MRNEPMRRNDLPETCFSILPSSGQLIIIKKGESGYYPSEWDTGSREENREIASSHNARRSITDIQEAAMLAGSMFGWNTPGANPQWYLDNARYVNSNIVQGHIKGPIMSVYYPVSSFLLRYQVPNLLMPSVPEVHLGKYAELRREYLKKHRRVLYTNLKTSGKLTEHLTEIEQTAQRMVEQAVAQMAQTEGVTEELKVTDPLHWTGLMNNLRHSAEELVLSDLIYS